MEVLHTQHFYNVHVYEYPQIKKYYYSLFYSLLLWNNCKISFFLFKDLYTKQIIVYLSNL